MPCHCSRMSANTKNLRVEFVEGKSTRIFFQSYRNLPKLPYFAHQEFEGERGDAGRQNQPTINSTSKGAKSKKRDRVNADKRIDVVSSGHVDFVT